jgi:hypothetical protein
MPSSFINIIMSSFNIVLYIINLFLLCLQQNKQTIKIFIVCQQ